MPNAVTGKGKHALGLWKNAAVSGISPPASEAWLDKRFPQRGLARRRPGSEIER